MSKQDLGRRGEELAVKELRRRGFRIIERNYRCRYGEIDIIAARKGRLSFIEVRTKAGGSYGTAEESITGQKRERLANSAEEYISSHRGLPENWGIDFVAVDIDSASGKPLRVELLENALG